VLFEGIILSNDPFIMYDELNVAWVWGHIQLLSSSSYGVPARVVSMSIDHCFICQSGNYESDIWSHMYHS